jgi:hypothetical protein
MRRFVALIALFVLSLSRFGAVATPSSAHARSIGRIETHELAAPTVRLAAHVLREAAPREQPRAVAPWLPAPSFAPLGAHAGSRSARGDLTQVDQAALGEWRAFTYDATAPPALS